MSSWPEPLHAERVARRARAVLAAGGVVLVDGRSGSGKTTFAARAAGAPRARLLRLDDLYPGWDGLDAAAAAVVRDLLVPRRAGLAAHLRRWDWAGGRVGAPLVVPADGPLVIEGCGALSRAAAPLADLRIWVELDGAARRRRALDRDGQAFAPHWSAWARQEARFIARERPRALADAVLDGRTVRPASSARPATTHYSRTS